MSNIDGEELEDAIEKVDLRVKQVMSPDPLTVDSEETVEKVARAMAESGFGSCLVVDDGKIIGIVTERDIVRRVAALGVSSTMRVKEIMTNPIIVLNAEATIEEALDVMASKRIRRLPIIDGHKLVGVVSLTDIARALVAKLGYQSSILNALARESNPPNGIYG